MARLSVRAWPIEWTWAEGPHYGRVWRGREAPEYRWIWQFGHQRFLWRQRPETPKPGDDSRRKLMEAERARGTMPKVWNEGEDRDTFTPEYKRWHRAVLRAAPLSWRARWRWFDFREWLARRIAPWAVKDITDA